MDVDGTLTDGKIYMSDEGELCKAFNIKDGYGIKEIAIPAGITPVIITGRRSKLLERRCAEIGITEIYQGVSDKLSKAKEITDDFSETAYIGDDLNDRVVMQYIKDNGGFLGCPADSAEGIIEISDYVCKRDGGEGAVREFIEWLVKQ